MGARPDPLYYARWWDATLNVVGGCEVVDSSCAYCYVPWRAAGIQTTLGVELYLGTSIYTHDRYTWNGNTTVLPPDHPAWNWPLKWRGFRTPLLGPGQPNLIWLDSMSDLFHREHPREAIHRVIETVALSRHIGVILTKHPGPMAEYFRDKPEWWRRQIWLGFSAGDPLWFDRRWELMRPLAEQDWLVFVSLQPLLRPVTLPPDFLRLARWVICGGEQFPGNREMDLDWARDLRDQCVAAGVPIYVKQATRGWLPPDLRRFRDHPKV